MAVSSAARSCVLVVSRERQRVIEIELADDVAQRRQRQLLEAPRQVLHLVGRAHRIGDEVVDDRVHLHRHVVARDHRLRLDLGDLLAQVDRRAHRIEERHDRVQARFGGAVELAEPLDDLHLLLRDDPDRPHQHDQQEDRQAEKDDAVHARVTSSTMPSAPTTRTFVPAAIDLGAARRPVLAADVDAAGAERRVDVVRHDAVPADQRVGARRHARGRRAGRAAAIAAAASDTLSTTTNSADLRGDAVAEVAPPPAPATAPMLTNTEPEMRDRHFDDGGDERDAEPAERPPARTTSHGKERADHTRKSGRVRPGVPGHGVPTSISTRREPEADEQARPLGGRRRAPCAPARGRRARARRRRTSPRCARPPRSACRALHRLAEMIQDLLHVRAEAEVEQQAEQHLQVERHHRAMPQRSASERSPSTLPRTAARTTPTTATSAIQRIQE